ncbi:Asp_protease_2 domain-containing protein [Cucumis melo var. makuwa]|uniref:Asp_protease_2 domain-containing protein n=1 Tax=Cucumis melo var. makuwa TaxID=1194695 RepID=A0A5A7UDE5_CUCMM|nr:Asp_protease_2 domain-containing protein [Cucumis melo var. makuwa]TYK04152.1 Asp_protease_2 domain-containing protein [Cucumis melo var. makuwa]
MSEKDKIFYFVEGLKPWANTKLYEQRVPDLMSAYAAAERLFDLISDSQDASLTPDSDDKLGQAEGEVDQIEGGENPRIGALKYLSSLQKRAGERSVPAERGLLYVDTLINQKQTKSTMVDSDATHNFITETKARCLRLRWEKDSEKIKVVNSVALPIVGLVKRTIMKLGGWEGLVDFVVVKMDDFNVVLGMEFLLEHQVIPMPSARCIVITGYFPTVVQADIRQPNGFKMISAMQLDKSPIQEKPTSVALLLEALEKLVEIVPKDTRCVLEKYHGVMPNSGPKSLLMRRMIDHGIESLSEAKGFEKNAYRMLPLKLAKLLIKQFVEGFLKKASSLTELLKEDIQWGGNPECQAAFDGLKQRNSVQLLNVIQFDHSAQTDLLIRRSQFEIDDSRHSVLLLLADGPYVGNNPQVHRFEKDREQMADIARACLEEALRQMEKRVDQKKCPLEIRADDQVFNQRWNNVVRLSVDLKPEEDREVKEILADRVRKGRSPTREIHKFLLKWKEPSRGGNKPRGWTKSNAPLSFVRMFKFSINGGTMSYDYLLT